MRTALTIAGSDSIAGAGIQADLKTFAALDVYGVSALTAITAQNTRGIADILALPASMVRSQINQVTADVQIASVKTGMLATSDIVAAVAEALRTLRDLRLVVDPVLAAGGSNGRTLLAAEAVSILTAQLLPLTTVVTPNVSEAAVLSGIRVTSAATAREAAKRIAGFGAAAVVIKGGHFSGPDAVDVLFHGGTFVEFSSSRFPHGEIHGTGCAFAAAVAAGLAIGDDVPAAVGRAKRYITGAIEHSLVIGGGARILNHFWQRRL